MANSDWIKTSDKLPEEHQRVLVTLVDSWIDTAEFCGRYYMISGEYYYGLSEILAWQPLPDPYREENENERE